MFPSKRARYEADYEADDDDSFLPVGVTSTSEESHSSIQQPCIYSSDVTQRIDTDPIYPVITQGQMYSQAFYQPAMLGQYYGMDPRSSYNPYKLPGVSTQPFYSSSVAPRFGTNPQLISSESVYPGMIQYPSGMSQQQIMGMSSNTSRARVVPTNMGVPHIGPADSRSVSFQSSSISNPNDVSLYSHSTNPAAGPPQLVFENFNNPSSSLLPPPSSLQRSLLNDWYDNLKKDHPEGLGFYGSSIQLAFYVLNKIFSSYFSKTIIWSNNDVRGWSKQYCDEHWHDENLNWNVSSADELFDMLKGSSYYNPINPGLLKFLADKSGDVFLINCVKNYEKEFSCENIEDIDLIGDITIIGNNISSRESTLIVNTLLENKMTIGQLWNLCSPKIPNYDIFDYNDVYDDNDDIVGYTLTLDATESLLEFYYSVKDNETFLAKAKRENQVIDFQHIKILLTGSAAVGKTSFCNLLFQSQYSSEYTSTEVMEAKQAMIMNFSMLKQKTNKKEVIWLKLDPKNQIPHIKTLLKSRVFHQINNENNPEILQECASTFNNSAQEMLYCASDSADDLQDNDDDNDNDDDDDDYDDNDDDENNDGDDDDDVIDDSDGERVFTDVQRKIISSELLSKTLVIDKNETVKFITVIDSGGQPEYIHMLPAINNCPTINFVVLDMTKHLDDPVMVQYKSKHDQNFTDYPLHYSNLDMIGLLMSLTTDSLEQPTKQTPTKARASVPNKSFIGFVGTHKDKLEKESCKERIAALNDRLTSIVEERDCKFAVLPAENGILFPVDNTTAGNSDSEDPVVKMLRRKVEDFMDKMERSGSSDNQLPITWMILELELQELYQNNGTKYITYEEYKKIATESASMVPEEVEESLEHFDFLGVLLNFKEVRGLCNYVIVDHQWLFDSLALIMHLSPDDIDFQDHHYKKQFKENKLLAKSELCIINWTDELCPEYFFNLLVYLKVIAIVVLNEVEYYYMPCVLSNTKLCNDKYRFLYSEPLLVQFSSGFLPRGFFCSLVVHLLQNLPTGWDHQLHNTEHFGNVITFRLPDKSFLRLHDKTSYLEVQIRHHTRNLCISYHSKVFPVLCKYFKEVCSKLNFNHEKLQYGFLCHDGKSNDDHIAVIKPFTFLLPSELECCRKCSHATKLGEFHRIWFEEMIGEAGADIQLNVTSRSSQDSSAHVQVQQTTRSTDTPKMAEIIKIVIPQIQAEWEKVAYILHYSIPAVKAIKESNQNSEKCCLELFVDWLSTDHGAGPKTWSTLIEKLKEVEDLTAATNEIIDELHTRDIAI